MRALGKIVKMNLYLKEVKTLIKEQNKPVLVVIGNESVDLDSAVSSICLAYLLAKVGTNSHVIPAAKRSKQFLVAPVINANRHDLPLKTEVTHWLISHHIQLDNLLCRDEINLSEHVENFVLVDHHVSEFREKVISVLDHRPFDSVSNLNSDCYINIQEVGSCATLVCDALRKDVRTETLKADYLDALKLCYGPIVLDTINFSKTADKVRPLDIEVGEFIERFLNIEAVMPHRKQIYEELVTARADVSSLNSLQILSKDLKIISGKDGGNKVAIPGVDVFKYIEMENAADNVRAFAEREDVDLVVLMGMVPKSDTVERFVGFINIKNAGLYDRVSCS